MRFLLFFTVLFVLSCATGPKKFNPPRQYVVKASVANVRAETKPHAGTYKFDPLQETQVVQGEPVLVHEQRGDWVRVEVPEQLEFSHNQKWEGYPGWVKKSALTKDMSKIHTLKRLDAPEKDLRKEIVKQAAKHLNHPYLWGGRSLHDKKNTSLATGVDCSGLVNWSYRQTGWFIPRDSHEQYMRAQPIDPKNLKTADLIFLAKKEKPKKIVHVALYTYDDELIEAPFSGEKVRIMTFKKRFGFSRYVMKQGFETDKYVIYFGSFFPQNP